MTVPVTPPKSGMPKWLIILLVVLLIVALGCCGGFAACTWMCQRAANNAGGALNAMGEQMKKQAEENLKKQGVEVDTSGAGLAMPADFPKDLPVFSGYKVNAKSTPPGGKGGTISLTGSSSLKAVQDFYTSEMAKQGWTQTGESADAGSFVQNYAKEKRSAMITSSDNGKTLVILYATE